MGNDEDIICVVEVNSWPWRQEFRLTTDAVTRSWRTCGGGNRGTKRFPLDSLTGRLNYQSTFAHGAGGPLARGGLLLGLAACVFFSQLNVQIPLLAPFLALIGLPFLTRGLCRLRQYEWTIIEKKDGGRALFIPHRGTSKADREAFETKLVDAIAALEG